MHFYAYFPPEAAGLSSKQQLRSCRPTLQHDEAHRPVQVDVLMLPLQEGHPAGEAAQQVIDHLGPTGAQRCAEQNQRRGRSERRSPHVPLQPEAPGQTVRQ